jgi:2-keto-4-pentenoate hydratase
MVEVVAARLADADEQLRAGDRIITGVLAPPHKPAPGDQMRLELDEVGAVALRFGD